MHIIDHQLIDGDTVIDLPRLAADGTVAVWRVPVEYRASGLFVAVHIPGQPQEVPACNHGAPEIVGSLSADAAAVVGQRIGQLHVTAVGAVQSRLDAFARTRNYDGILSACTYATSGVPRFAAEGQYAVKARDSTWSMMYDILTAAVAGLRPAPDSFADIEPELPVLAWPE